jgi:hypothetical protein
MKTMMLAAAALNLAVAVNPASALAAEPSSGNRYTMSQIAERQESNRSMSPRYEWQYHYGHHAQFEGHWVPVR